MMIDVKPIKILSPFSQNNDSERVARIKMKTERLAQMDNVQMLTRGHVPDIPPKPIDEYTALIHKLRPFLEKAIM